MTLVVGAEPGCSNRKVAKLIAMAEQAPDADIIVIGDADIAVDRDHLRRLVGELAADERTGVISCLYRARPGGPAKPVWCGGRFQFGDLATLPASRALTWSATDVCRVAILNRTGLQGMRICNR